MSADSFREEQACIRQLLARQSVWLHHVLVEHMVFLGYTPHNVRSALLLLSRANLVVVDLRNRVRLHTGA